MQLKVFYNDSFDVPLNEGHRFPMHKYKLIRQRLLREKVLLVDQLFKADLCSIKDLYLAHDNRYVDEVINLSLEPKKVRAVGLPLSIEMVNRARASVDAVIKSSYSAMENGFAASICGGTHHACFDRGEGFCYFNDFAVVCRKLFLEKPKIKILILDMDVHQGNGNALILKDDDYVDVISFHGEKNYPFKKVKSTIDVEFKSNTKDDEYLEELEKTLKLLSVNTYDLILYQAGVDTLADDSLGSLSLSFEGLIKRDEMIFNFAGKTPISMSLGGGYSKPIDKSVLASVNCYKVAKSIFKF